MHTQEILKKSDGTKVCASGDQLAALLAESAAAEAPTNGSIGAPSGQSTSHGAEDAATTSANDDAIGIPPSSSAAATDATSSPPVSAAADDIDPDAILKGANDNGDE